MSSGTPPHDDAHEWRNYLREMQRADRAAAVAARYELQSGQPPESMRPFRERMAALHRQMERRHRACARLYRLHNRRLQRWSDEGAEAERPPFMSAVADDLGLDSAAVILFDEQWQEVLTAASDARSRAAYDLEATVGCGPSRDVLGGLDYVLVGEAELTDRWPEYGSAAWDLGIRSVLAVPLAVGPGRLGALCAYSEHVRLPESAVPAAGHLADVLANEVLLHTDRTDTDGATPRGALYDDADYWATVNQAVGMVAVQSSCSVDTALLLIRARAFAEGVPLPELARRIVEERYLLC